MYDAIVVGARCAGAPLAMLLARQGRRVLLVDRSLFPSNKMSTHLMKRAGLARLKAWGLLDRVLAAGAPHLEQWDYNYQGTRILGNFEPVDGLDFELATRRLELDSILIDAAIEAGVEFRQGFTVLDVLRKDGRVAGVRGENRAGHSENIDARLVVGADGMQSQIALKVGARFTTRLPTENCGYYAYFQGLPRVATLETHLFQSKRLLIHFPTNEDLDVVFLFWPQAEHRAVRADLEAAFDDALALVPSLHAAVQVGRRESRFMGTNRFDNFIRKSWGPGWALAGDAAMHRDPITAYGMTHAFVDADLLARAVGSSIDDPRALDRGLAAYEAARLAVSRPSFDATVEAARMDVPEGVDQMLWRISQGSQGAKDGFIARLDASINATVGAFEVAA